MPRSPAQQVERSRTDGREQNVNLDKALQAAWGASITQADPEDIRTGTRVVESRGGRGGGGGPRKSALRHGGRNGPVSRQQNSILLRAGFVWHSLTSDVFFAGDRAEAEATLKKHEERSRSLCGGLRTGTAAIPAIPGSRLAAEPSATTIDGHATSVETCAPPCARLPRG